MVQASGFFVDGTASDGSTWPFLPLGAGNALWHVVWALLAGVTLALIYWTYGGRRELMLARSQDPTPPTPAQPRRNAWPKAGPRQFASFGMNWDRTQPQDPRQREQARSRSAQPTQPPVAVPGYEPERFLGQGAYGQVWVAVEHATGRRVAIKFYTRRSGLDWSLLAREVEKLAYLFSDRYIVQLVGVGQEADPPYYIMEYLEQGSLEERIQQHGPLPVEEAVRIAREIATGLLHAHSKGVLHCDLKPANVLLDQDRRPRLCDFGQARLVHEQTPALGTLFYMAPEQADFDAVPDARWDVYALGAILYCMLTGEPPHRTEENVSRLEAASDTRQRLRAYRELIRSQPLPSVHRMVPGVDRHLAEIIQRCLEPDPEKRFPTVQAVLEAFQQRQRRLQRRPLLVLGVLGPLLLLAVVGVFVYRGFSTTLGQSAQALTRRALQSDRFAAWYVAEAVAGQVLQRWEALQEEARHPELVQLLKELALLEVGSPQWNAAQARLQRWLHQARSRHANLDSTSWFVNAASGVQLGRVPLDRNVLGRNFAYRDYFHGQGRDFPPGTTGQGIITHPHLSVVFVSRATGNQMVAFSVPVRDPRRPEGPPVGILAMTVELGRFTEVQRDQGDMKLVTALVDTKPDSRPDGSQGRPGSLLEHPYLAQLQRQKKQAGSRSPLPQIYLPEEVTRRAVRLVQGQLSGTEAERLAVLVDYQDPVPDKRFAGRWLAALEPVVVSAPWGRESTGWVVLVQEKRAEALDPLVQVRAGLVRLGLWGLWSVVLVLCGVWAGAWVLRHQGRASRWWYQVRKHLGMTVTTQGPGSRRGLPTPRGPAGKQSSTAVAQEE